MRRKKVKVLDYLKVWKEIGTITAKEYKLMVRNYLKGRRDKMRVVLFVAFLVLILLTGVAVAFQIPKELEFMKDFTVIEISDCRNKETGKEYTCIVLIDPEGVQYLVAVDKEEIYEVYKFIDGKIIKLFPLPLI